MKTKKVEATREICIHCGYPIKWRSKYAECDHLYYPESCRVCSQREPQQERECSCIKFCATIPPRVGGELVCYCKHGKSQPVNPWPDCSCGIDDSRPQADSKKAGFVPLEYAKGWTEGVEAYIAKLRSRIEDMLALVDVTHAGNKMLGEWIDKDEVLDELEETR